MRMSRKINPVIGGGLVNNSCYKINMKFQMQPYISISKYTGQWSECLTSG